MLKQPTSLASFEAFLNAAFPNGVAGSVAARQEESAERAARLKAFPFSVVIELPYTAMDFADRWCWSQFGASDGECAQSHSHYPACRLDHPHSHTGRWMTHWLAKTDYDYGFCEWCFRSESDQDRFTEFVRVKLSRLDFWSAFPAFEECPDDAN